MRIRIDRDLPVPVGVQIQGLIEYGVSNGDFPPGSRLPSVRDLATELKVSPVTVSQAYKELQAKGLIDTTPGSGTYVRASLAPLAPTPPRSRVDSLLNAAVRAALREGTDLAQTLERLQRVLARQARAEPPLTGLLVGIFPAVTRAYAADLRRHVSAADRLLPTTIDELRSAGTGSGARFDFALTFAHRLQDVIPLLPAGTPTATLQMIPSERTRTALAEIDPLDRVVLVSRFPEFMATFKFSVERFASHVADVRAVVWGSPEAPDAIATADVVIYGTGSEDVLDGMPADVRTFEFRHVPDPIHTETTLIPFIDRLRHQLRPQAARHEEAP